MQKIWPVDGVIVIDPSCSLSLNMAQSEGILRHLITKEDTNTEVEELGLAL